MRQFVLIATLQTWKLCPLGCRWPHSSNTVSLPPFICFFHPICTPPPSTFLTCLSVCLLLLLLLSGRQSAYQMEVLRWSLSLSALLHVSVIKVRFSHVENNSIQKYRGEKKWGSKREVGKRYRIIISPLLNLLWQSGCLCQWNNSESIWTVFLY